MKNKDLGLLSSSYHLHIFPPSPSKYSWSIHIYLSAYTTMTMHIHKWLSLAESGKYTMIKYAFLYKMDIFSEDTISEGNTCPFPCLFSFLCLYCYFSSKAPAELHGSFPCRQTCSWSYLFKFAWRHHWVPLQRRRVYFLAVQGSGRPSGWTAFMPTTSHSCLQLHLLPLLREDNLWL